MARKKISEFTSKTLIFGEIGVPYVGVTLIGTDTITPAQFDKNKLYVVKIDEGIKGRMKKGLVALQVPGVEIRTKVQEFMQKGYTRFLVEEFLPHDSSQEKYFSIERTREGKRIYYSNKGGIDIESNQDVVKKDIITEENSSEIALFLGMDVNVFQSILSAFDACYISFMEVNPLVINENNFYFLDLAVEVDSSAEFFVKNSWNASEYVGDELLGEKTVEEKNILELKAKSQAAFKLDMLNPNGSIWMLLSGGGASIVLADEVYNQGRGQDVANYGEYSGNPNQEETYIYTKNFLHLLIRSQAQKKVLIIGGGVANFTDINTTFKGVIRALDEVKEDLDKQHLKVFVRRGGPNQEAGLTAMKTFLHQTGILGGVWDQSLILSEVITKAIDYLDK